MQNAELFIQTSKHRCISIKPLRNQAEKSLRIRLQIELCRWSFAKFCAVDSAGARNWDLPNYRVLLFTAIQTRDSELESKVAQDPVYR